MEKTCKACGRDYWSGEGDACFVTCPKCRRRAPERHHEIFKEPPRKLAPAPYRFMAKISNGQWDNIVRLLEADR